LLDSLLQENISMNTLINPKVVVILAFPLLVLIYLFAHKPSSDSADQMANTRPGPDMWHKIDLLSQKLPAIEEIVKKVKIKHSEMNICGAATFTQQADPPEGVSPTGKVVLLLHGAAFTSQTWVDKVQTIATLAALGHRVMAIDLPGFGKTKVYDKEATEDKGSYLAEVIDTLTTPGEKPVVITPSMSGSFIIPMLARSPEKISAWVPVAPVSTDKGRTYFPKLEIPTMIVYGELDTSLGIRSRDDLILIKTSTEPQVLPGAKHPAYLDQPDLWHQLLYNFISALPA